MAWSLRVLAPLTTTARRRTWFRVSTTLLDGSAGALQAADNHWNTAWVKTIDKDFDPMYGDLGKVDNGGLTGTTGGDDMADNFVATDDSNACTASDGGTAHGFTATGASINNGTLCDAEDVEIETSVTFPLGLGYGCDPITVDYTLTCQWDSRGNRTNAIPVPDDQISLPEGTTTASNIGDFVTCKVAKN